MSLNEVRFVNVGVIKYMYTCARALSMCRHSFTRKNLRSRCTSKVNGGKLIFQKAYYEFSVGAFFLDPKHQ